MKNENKIESFFNSGGIISNELINSKIIAWIFSKDNSSISTRIKSKILNKLFEMDGKEEFEEIDSITEYMNMDIIIKTEKINFVIENKIKSTEHSSQTKKYYTKMEDKFKGKNKYLFLTLIGTKAEEKEFKNKTYKDLYDILNSNIKSENSNIILKEYLNSLKKLISLYDFFENKINENWKNIDSFKTIDFFKKEEQSSEKKEEKEIIKNKLKMIFSKKYFLQKLKNIKREDGWVLDSKGTVEAGFKIFENKGMYLELIFTHKKLRIAFCKSDYWNSKKGEKEEELEFFKNHIENLNEKFRYNYGKSKARYSANRNIVLTNENYEKEIEVMIESLGVFEKEFEEKKFSKK
jgi:hypothetical protein